MAVPVLPARRQNGARVDSMECVFDTNAYISVIHVIF